MENLTFFWHAHRQKHTAQNAPKHYFKWIIHFFLGRGITPFPDPFPGGKGYPLPHPTSYQAFWIHPASPRIPARFTPLVPSPAWQSRPNNAVWRRTGAIIWRTGRNIYVGFDSSLFPTLYGNMTSSTKPEVHNVSQITMPSEKDRATVTGNMYKQFGETWHSSDFWDMPADRQTDTLITILRTPIPEGGGEIEGRSKHPPPKQSL